MLYHGHRLIDVESILIKQPCVCLALFFVECGWISLFSSADILQRMLMVYPELLGRAIGKEVFGQLASVINFRVCGGKFCR